MPSAPNATDAAAWSGWSALARTRRRRTLSPPSNARSAGRRSRGGRKFFSMRTRMTRGRVSRAPYHLAVKTIQRDQSPSLKTTSPRRGHGHLARVVVEAHGITAHDRNLAHLRATEPRARSCPEGGQEPVDAFMPGVLGGRLVTAQDHGLPRAATTGVSAKNTILPVAAPGGGSPWPACASRSGQHLGGRVEDRQQQLVQRLGFHRRSAYSLEISFSSTISRRCARWRSVRLPLRH